MAEIELVIKIDEEVYKKAKETHDVMCDSVWLGIKNGTPLSKGHGRLGDLDDLRKEISSWGMNDYEPEDFIEAIDWADTIIEADKEYEAKVITRGNCMMCGKELTEGLFFCKECGEKVNSRKGEADGE